MKDTGCGIAPVKQAEIIKLLYWIRDLRKLLKSADRQTETSMFLGITVAAVLAEKLSKMKG